MGGPPSTGKNKQLKGPAAALTGTGPCQMGPKVIEPAQGEFKLELSIIHQKKSYILCGWIWRESLKNSSPQSPWAGLLSVDMSFYYGDWVDFFGTDDKVYNKDFLKFKT